MHQTERSEHEFTSTYSLPYSLACYCNNGRDRDGASGCYSTSQSFVTNLFSYSSDIYYNATLYNKTIDILTNYVKLEASATRKLSLAAYEYAVGGVWPGIDH